ncbi:hypothetical protein TELCIR_17708 [Teladorsagia circumcincta]|uniref:SHSP domain-containing protein n=1 Tax=Teladorsagia circumcincta TaxID=45464 RepID=A0A2G9TS04_TELCI|nr:hypothetical protein TELCIR_17708 [Teladorsagia circumcincta]
MSKANNNLVGKSVENDQMGKAKQKWEEGRSFVRQWTLPKDVDIDQLKSSITEDGHLSIEAPKLKPEPAAVRAKSIPIHKAPAKEQ